MGPIAPKEDMMPIPKNLPQTVTEAYPSKWLHAADLDGKTLVVVIDDVSIEAIRNRSGGDDMKPVLTLAGLDKRLILNKTQCKALAQLAGTEVMNDWIGGRVRLAVGVAPNKKATILIQKAPQQNTPPPPQQSKPAAQPPAPANGNGKARSLQPHQEADIIKVMMDVYGAADKKTAWAWADSYFIEDYNRSITTATRDEAEAFLKSLMTAEQQPEAAQPETEAA